MTKDYTETGASADDNRPIYTDRRAVKMEERLERMKRELSLFMRAIEAEHPDDSYGACVRCYKSHTEDGHQAHPCATLRLARGLFADYV